MRIDNVTAQDLIDRRGMLRSTYKVEVTTEALCKDLLEARSLSIWKDAPEDAEDAQVIYYRRTGAPVVKGGFHRKLPKSKEEVLAEKLVKIVKDVQDHTNILAGQNLKELFISVLNNAPS